MSIQFMKLEKIYLANVVLYLNDIDSAINFCCINTKCFDALQIIRINPQYKVARRGVFENYTESKQSEYTTYKRIAKLFSNLETFVVPQESLQLTPKCAEHIVLTSYNGTIQIPDNMTDRLVEITIGIRGFALNLDQFPFLRKVHFTAIIAQKLENFFGSKAKRYDLVEVTHQYYSNNDVGFYKKVNLFNFGKFVVRFYNIGDLKAVIDEFPEFTTIAISCVTSVGELIYPNTYLFSPNNKVFQFSSDIPENVIQLYAFGCVQVTKNADLDLSKFPALYDLDISVAKNVDLPTTLTALTTTRVVDVTSCVNLEKLETSGCVWDVIPSSVKELIVTDGNVNSLDCNEHLISLTFSNEVSYKKGQKERCDKHDGRTKAVFALPLKNCVNLKSVSINEFKITNSFTHLTNLKELVLTECSVDEIDADKVFYPNNLVSLKCRHSQLPKVETTQHLTSMCVAGFFAKSAIDISMYTTLCDVKLRSLNVDVKLPMIRRLEINASRHAFDLKYLSTLEIIVLDKFSGSIVLPTTIKTIVMNNSNPTVTNIDDIRPQVFLNGSTLRHSQVSPVVF
ncbi:hypothetical protein EIN_408920 [Entamoeba invadens IP1]|uniref:LRR containing protein n=1 Tax=Entamoeba invadens IP1 TaxID=370355 RepID=A0A0A1U279_ENTIV|nr:hypothetical protein EIN_408920 [Entamoeba invadens IP1]ELP85613.1 hypothetical protein EIN_408920 [Entamoeba invadens IP1]|eukprot:XP_004184959.1 hypothetical protein EIN_408920 [Entamoeba invadens IP1]